MFTKVWFQTLVATVGVRHYAIYSAPPRGGTRVVVAAIYRLTWLATASRVVATGVAMATLAGCRVVIPSTCGYGSGSSAALQPVWWSSC